MHSQQHVLPSPGGPAIRLTFNLDIEAWCPTRIQQCQLLESVVICRTTKLAIPGNTLVSMNNVRLNWRDLYLFGLPRPVVGRTLTIQTPSVISRAAVPKGDQNLCHAISLLTKHPAYLPSCTAAQLAEVLPNWPMVLVTLCHAYCPKEELRIQNVQWGLDDSCLLRPRHFSSWLRKRRSSGWFPEISMDCSGSKLGFFLLDPKGHTILPRTFTERISLLKPSNNELEITKAISHGPPGVWFIDLTKVGRQQRTLMVKGTHDCPADAHLHVTRIGPAH